MSNGACTELAILYYNIVPDIKILSFAIIVCDMFTVNIRSTALHMPMVCV